MALRCLIFLTLAAAASAKEVSPIDKVISLLDGMKTELETESASEATAYESFACFCKDTTGTKTTSVNDGNDKIQSESADLADKTQTKKEKSTELTKRKAKQETLAAELQEENTRCAKEKAEYEVEEADLSKAISSLKNAIKSMEASKPAAFLQGAIGDDLRETLAMADAMNMIAVPKKKAIASMIQSSATVDPADPEYGYHSNDILDLLNNLLTDFKGQKVTLDAEWSKTKTACDEKKLALKTEMGTNSDAMDALDLLIEKLAGEIAAHRQTLVEAEATMKDDELYLKDLTARCEARANDYDQRSSMRNDEITAMTQALAVLNDDVKGRADEVNQRALLIQKILKADAKAAPIKKASSKSSKVNVQAAKAVEKPISFLQGDATKNTGFLAAGLSNAERKDKALALLSKEGLRLSSFVLTSLAQRSAGDPFKKVKGLIQKLIERLIAEATAEATKKGFCDTELGKSRKERDFRRMDTKKLSADLEGLEAKRDALTEEIKTLGENIIAENIALKETTAERVINKKNNMATLSTAKEGLDAVNKALLILRSFYKQAAKASFIQASPVDEDTQGAGFSGSYKGNQSGSKAIFALLETIASDFDRTYRTTEAAEQAAHRDYVEYTQTAQSSIAAKSTQKELDEADLKTTMTSLTTKMEDLQTAQRLLDDALMELEELKPVCIDTGMSYAERVEKREEEVEALNHALCILDPNGVEAACQLN